MSYETIISGISGTFLLLIGIVWKGHASRLKTVEEYASRCVTDAQCLERRSASSDKMDDIKKDTSEQWKELGAQGKLLASIDAKLKLIIDNQQKAHSGGS